MNFFFCCVIVSLMSWKASGQVAPAPNANTENNGNGGSDNGFGGTPPPPTETVSTTVQTTLATTSTSSYTVSQGPNPPTPTPLNCDEYKCGQNLPVEPSPEQNPMVVRSRLANPNSCNEKMPPAGRVCQYKIDSASNMCYGVYCLTIAPGNEYCICGPDQIGYQCSSKKPGSCDSATGLLPSSKNMFKAENKRWRQMQNPDHGSVYARHFAVSGSDCIRMCQWASGRCNSINYGPINGVQVCELLSVIVSDKSMLKSWLVDAPGWTYTNVLGKAAAI